MPPGTQERITVLIELLEKVRPIPHLYMVRHDPDLAVAFLCGVEQTAERLLGIGTRELRWQVGENRGWKIGARGPILHMRREGLSDEKIVDELIAIEIEVW